jgi:hypothetical protein
MDLKQTLGKTCVWCVMVAVGLLSLLTVIWMVLLANAHI